MRSSDSNPPPWKRQRPGGSKPRKLTPQRVALARRRAESAKRRYPNLVDNMWAARLTDEDIARLGIAGRGDAPLV